MTKTLVGTPDPEPPRGPVYPLHGATTDTTTATTTIHDNTTLYPSSVAGNCATVNVYVTYLASESPPR